MTSLNNAQPNPQSIGSTMSVQMSHLSTNPTFAKLLDQGGAIALILALALLLEMLTRFVEAVKK